MAATPKKTDTKDKGQDKGPPDFTKEQELVTIEQSLLDQQVAVATLVVAGMPEIAMPAKEIGS